MIDYTIVNPQQFNRRSYFFMTTNLPDNLISRISRLSVQTREFKADDGKTVKYDRLFIEVIIKGETVEIEQKIDKKDILILSLADDIKEAF